MYPFLCVSFYCKVLVVLILQFNLTMEIHTAVKASSSSGMQMQLDEQINFIKRKTDKLSITENLYEIEREEYDQFINKAKKEINNFTQLIREFVKGSLKIKSIAPFDVEILDIHWNRIFVDVKDPNDAVIHIIIDIDEETELEGELDVLIRKSIQPVERLLMSDEHPSLHDDLKALEKEQFNWQMLDLGISCGSDSDSDSEDKGMMLDYEP